MFLQTVFILFTPLSYTCSMSMCPASFLAHMHLSFVNVSQGEIRCVCFDATGLPFNIKHGRIIKVGFQRGRIPVCESISVDEFCRNKSLRELQLQTTVDRIAHKCNFSFVCVLPKVLVLL